MIEFIGKFHPLLLHLPIGILLYAFLHWMYEYVYAKKEIPTDFTFALTFGALSAIASAVSGWILAGNGGYDEQLLQWHKYLGIATAVGAVVLLFGYKRGWSHGVFTLFFAGFTLLIGATGHYGGSLTHGEEFLTATSLKKAPLVLENPPEAHIFNDIVMPIVELKCVSCHNPQKSKGDLLFQDLDGWLKGGKNGAVLQAGLAVESSIIHRIFLPKEDEEHMPPAGKVQLTNEERNFLEWWIDNMENYDHQIKDLATTPEIEAYLKSLQAQVPLDVDRPTAQQLATLTKYGILASLQSDNLPWVEVRLTQPDSFVVESLRRLKKIAPAIKSIDLSHSKVTDADLKLLQRLENVEHINLSHSMISSTGVSHLEQLPHLKNLNLYDSQVDSTVFSMLASMKELEKVYLWQTPITVQQSTEWQLAHPSMEVVQGVDFEQFGSPVLVSPMIAAEHDLFTDSLLITFETNAARSTIKYTLDGSIPTTNSTTYTAPFHIYETTEVKAILALPGWTDSEPAARTFAKSRYPIVQLQLSVPPNERYYAEGAKTLFNLQKGTDAFSDGNWLGFSRDDVVVTADLGGIQKISGITIGTLSDFNSYIHLPKSIEVATSVDGRRYTPFERKDITLIEEPTAAQVHNYLLRSEEVAARYIRVKLQNQKVNPPWHPAPGADCWLFLDEVLVE